MQIFVAGATTKVIQLDSDDFQELNRKVQESFGIPTDEQVLHFSGKLLYNREASFERKGIRDSMTIHLSMRLRGGRGELEVADVDCLPVDLLDPSQLPPPTMEREMSHGTSAAHDFCIPEAEASGIDKQAHSETLDKEDDYYDDNSKPPDFERGDSLLNAFVTGGPSCPSPTRQPEKQPSVPDSPALKPSATPSPSVGTKRTLDQTPRYHMAATAIPGGLPMPSFPGHLAMGFQGGPFGPSSQRMPFFPTSVPHPALVHKRQKGLAYDLDLVDDKLKKRLLKNRQSAERSRQKKNAMMKGLEEQLQDRKDECEALRHENALLRAQLAAHHVPIPEGVGKEPPATPSTSRVDFASVKVEEHDSAGSCESEA